MGIDYIFVNLDKKEYIDSPRTPHTKNEMLFLVYLIMYDWNGDRIRCVRDPESLWDKVFGMCKDDEWKLASTETYKDWREDFDYYRTLHRKVRK